MPSVSTPFQRRKLSSVKAPFIAFSSCSSGRTWLGGLVVSEGCPNYPLQEPQGQLPKPPIQPIRGYLKNPTPMVSRNNTWNSAKKADSPHEHVVTFNWFPLVSQTTSRAQNWFGYDSKNGAPKHLLIFCSGALRLVKITSSKFSICGSGLGNSLNSPTQNHRGRALMILTVAHVGMCPTKGPEKPVSFGSRKTHTHRKV